MSDKTEGESSTSAAPKKAGESSQKLKETKLVESRSRGFIIASTYECALCAADTRRLRSEVKSLRFDPFGPQPISSPPEISPDSDDDPSSFFPEIEGGHFASAWQNVTVGELIECTRLRTGFLQHELLGKLNVTLKILQMEQKREAAQCFKLPPHQNVIRHIAIGIFTNDRQHHICIAMEDCYYQSLVHIHLNEPYLLKRYFSYSRQLAEGVKFLHDHGATLRNFKPDNILLNTDKTKVKIHDFGFNFKTSTESHESSTDWWSFEAPTRALDVLCLGLVCHFLWSHGNYALKYDVHELRLFSVTQGENLKLSEEFFVARNDCARSLLKRMLASNPSDRPSMEEILRHHVFSVLENAISIGDKSTSIADLVLKIDVATEPVETDVYSRSGVTTKFGSHSDSTDVFASIPQKRCKISAVEPSTGHGEMHDQEAEEEYQEVATGYDLIEWLEKYQGTDILLKCVREYGLSIVEHTLTASDIQLISLSLASCSLMKSLEIVSCGPPDKLHDLCQSLQKIGCEIPKLCLEGIPNIGQYAKDVLSVMETCQTSCLHMTASELSAEDVKNFETEFVRTKIHLDEFDVRHDEIIDSEVFQRLGEMMEKCNKFCSKLSIVDCEVTDEKLDSLVKSLTNTQLDKLNISCNPQLTCKGFERLGSMLYSCGIDGLGISSCDLTAEKLSRLTNTPLSKMTSLDVSYNRALGENEMVEIAKMVEKGVVHSLNMAGCKLDQKKLQQLKSLKIRKLNVSDNFSIGSGVIELANIAKNSECMTLDMSTCMLVVEHVEDFAKSLANTKIYRLDLSDRRRTADERYITAVLGLLPYITDTLIIHFGKLDSSCRKLIQENLNQQESLNIKIEISRNETLRKETDRKW